MSKPSANFPIAVLPAYQELGTANDGTNASFTQATTVNTNAGYAAAGAVAITAAGTPFSVWPAFGFVQNINSGEIMLYNSISGNNTLNVLATGRGLAGTIAALGNNGDVLNLIEARVCGKLLNQIMAELTALSNIGKTNNITATPRAILNTESHQRFTNVGAAALMIMNLPAAASGLNYRYVVENVNGIRVVAAGGADVVIDGNVTSAANGNIQSTDVGATLELVGTSNGKWIAEYKKGTWTTT